MNLYIDQKNLVHQIRIETTLSIRDFLWLNLTNINCSHRSITWKSSSSPASLKQWPLKQVSNIEDFAYIWYCLWKLFACVAFCWSNSSHFATGSSMFVAEWMMLLSRTDDCLILKHFNNLFAHQTAATTEYSQWMATITFQWKFNAIPIIILENLVAELFNGQVENIKMRITGIHRR